MAHSTSKLKRNGKAPEINVCLIPCSTVLATGTVFAPESSAFCAHSVRNPHGKIHMLQTFVTETRRGFCEVGCNATSEKYFRSL